MKMVIVGGQQVSTRGKKPSLTLTRSTSSHTLPFLPHACPLSLTHTLTHILSTSHTPYHTLFSPHTRPAVSTAWLATLLSAIPHLPKDVIKREILNIAVANGQLSQTVSSRQASCQIIGKMAPKFEPFWWVILCFCWLLWQQSFCHYGDDLLYKHWIAWCA